MEDVVDRGRDVPMVDDYQPPHITGNVGLDTWLHMRWVSLVGTYWLVRRAAQVTMHPRREVSWVKLQIQLKVWLVEHHLGWLVFRNR